MVAALEVGVALGDQHPLVGVADALNIDAQPKAVEQLRAQLAFLGIHRADEDESRRVRERHPLPLDRVHAHRGGVQQHVHDVVVEKIDLVDVKNVAIGLGEDPWFKAPGAGAQRGLDVDRADDAILGGVDRQLDDAHPALVRRQHAGVVETNPALGAKGLAVVWIAPEMAAFDHVVLRQQPGKRPHGGRLASALLAADEHPADRGHDGVEDQGQLHRVLAHDRREGEDVPVEYDAHLVKNRWGTKGEDY